MSKVNEVSYWVAKMRHTQTVPEFDRCEHHARNAAEEYGERLVDYDAGPAMRDRWRSILAASRPLREYGTKYWREVPPP